MEIAPESLEPLNPCLVRDCVCVCAGACLKNQTEAKDSAVAFLSCLYKPQGSHSESQDPLRPFLDVNPATEENSPSFPGQCQRVLLLLLCVCVVVVLFSEKVSLYSWLTWSSLHRLC